MRHRKKNENDLQHKVFGWLTALQAHLELSQPAPSAGLWPELSPLKKEKKEKNVSAAAPAAPVLLYRLAERVLGELFDLTAPELEKFSGLLTGFSLSSLERDASAELAAELAAAPLLPAWTLATLQLTAQPTRQKRQGAFYTSPTLARRITAQTLAGAPVTTVLDPACGGGAFLLAALEFLAAQLSPDPAELLRERLYGLDLDPVAVGQTRLTLLLGLAELGRPSLILLYILRSQIRCGNALVGRLKTDFKGHIPYQFQDQPDQEPASYAENSHESYEKYRALRASWLAADCAAAEVALTAFEKGLAVERTTIQSEISRLPIFNAPDDGQKLAALAPFDWWREFPAAGQAGGFGAVLGNPPYVGFNDYSGIEKAYFAHTYPFVYNLKNDLLYYFIVRGVQLLRAGGRLGFVTSRFWKEAVYAAPLRKWLVENCCLLTIEDLGREQFFDEAEVDVCLLYLSRESPAADFAFSYAGNTLRLAQQTLGSAPWTWLRKLPAERSLLEKINAQSQPLGEIALCRTGVQSGLDEVFFLPAEKAARLGLEKAALRPALKNADIEPAKITWRNLQLIYPPPDFSEAAFPALWNYLSTSRAGLERRRRYDKPFPFYELQWPRELAVFDAPYKLLTPYKAPRNIFALDSQQFFFSTDIISVVFPSAWSLSQLYFAQNFLNSRLATFHFRSYGKPMGGGQWDYYANPVKKLAFPRYAIAENHPLSVLSLSQAEIDELVAQLYDLTPAECDLLLKLDLSGKHKADV